MPKKEFKGWKWECVDAEVVENTKDKLVIDFYGYIGIKKNGKRAFRGIVLPSENYCEWHKRMMKCLGNIERKYDSFPCRLQMCSLAGDKRKSDIDNAVQGIMDTFTELGIFPDDNKFVVSELQIKNLGYIKNCYITRVELSPYKGISYDDNTNHEGKNLKDFISYLKQNETSKIKND